MDLLLTGPMGAPRLTGNVDVLRIEYLGQADSNAGLLSLSNGSAEPVGPATPADPDAGTPLLLDIQVSAPRTSFINTRTARIDGQVDLQVRGTFERPQILGTVEILGGEYIFNGNRYFVREGTVDFSNPDALEPVFDVAAETRPRVTGQTFTVNVHLSGTLAGLRVELTSDPWLPESDIVTLLFGGAPNYETAEQRALASSQELQQRMFQTAGAALLASALTSRVGDVFERTGALDTVQITPLLNNETAFQQLDPSARITLGKRISPRVYLTYSRTLNTRQDEIILLEYDQSDRLSWVLSRNEDRSYALDFRLRYVF
jgi:autotransporter translocation and assembly factor TamB